MPENDQTANTAQGRQQPSGHTTGPTQSVEQELSQGKKHAAQATGSTGQKPPADPAQTGESGVTSDIGDVSGTSESEDRS